LVGAYAPACGGADDRAHAREDVRRFVVASFKKITQALLEARRTDAIKVLRAAVATTEGGSDRAVAALGPEIPETVDALEALQTSTGR